MTATLRAATTLPVSEVYGPVWQGEGPHLGRACTFVRLGHCPLSCAWCDTPYTWDHHRYDVTAEAPETPVTTVLTQVADSHPQLVVLTGGEPLLWQRRPAFTRLLAGLPEVHVETAGIIAPQPDIMRAVAWFTVSPKLANSGNAATKRLKPHALATFADLARRGRACFKFVATHPDDLTEIDQLASRYGLPAGSIWVMPEGTTPDAVLACHRAIAPAVAAAGYHTTTRLHVLLYGDQRRR